MRPAAVIGLGREDLAGCFGGLERARFLYFFMLEKRPVVRDIIARVRFQVRTAQTEHPAGFKDFEGLGAEFQTMVKVQMLDEVRAGDKTDAVLRPRPWF